MRKMKRLERLVFLTFGTRGTRSPLVFWHCGTLWCGGTWVQAKREPPGTYAHRRGCQRTKEVRLGAPAMSQSVRPAESQRTKPVRDAHTVLCGHPAVPLNCASSTATVASLRPLNTR